MKKIITLILASICAIGLIGCSEKIVDLQTVYPEYYNLSDFKGLEVYIWKTGDDAYRCGVLPGTNRGKTYEEILNLTMNGATIEEMKTILSSYDIEKDGIFIIPVKNPSSNYEIDDTDLAKIREAFWGTDRILDTVLEYMSEEDKRMVDGKGNPLESAE